MCTTLAHQTESQVGHALRTPTDMAALPQEDEEFDALPVVPLGDKKLRACMVTGLVKTEDQVRVPASRAAPPLPLC